MTKPKLGTRRQFINVTNTVSHEHFAADKIRSFRSVATLSLAVVFGLVALCDFAQGGEGSPPDPLSSSETQPFDVKGVALGSSKSKMLALIQKTSTKYACYPYDPKNPYFDFNLASGLPDGVLDQLCQVDVSVDGAAFWRETFGGEEGLFFSYGIVNDKVEYIEIHLIENGHFDDLLARMTTKYGIAKTQTVTKGAGGDTLRAAYWVRNGDVIWLRQTPLLSRFLRLQFLTSRLKERVNAAYEAARTAAKKGQIEEIRRKDEM